MKIKGVVAKLAKIPIETQMRDTPVNNQTKYFTLCFAVRRPRRRKESLQKAALTGTLHMDGFAVKPTTAKATSRSKHATAQASMIWNVPNNGSWLKLNLKQQMATDKVDQTRSDLSSKQQIKT